MNCTYTGTGTTCEESWDCTEWSSCINGTQTRTCTDLNKCNTTELKPAESKSCESPFSGFDFKRYVYPVVGLILIILIAIVLLLHKKEKGFVAIESDETKKLKKYAKEAEKRGYSKEQIRTSLIKKGWDKNSVDKALK
jgi:hypothetical protein